MGVRKLWGLHLVSLFCCLSSFGAVDEKERREEIERQHKEEVQREKDHTIIPYRPLLSGVADFALRESIEKNARLFTDQKIPIHTIAELKERLKDDLAHILKMLNQLGYYNAQVDYQLDLSVHPIVANIMIQTGPAYTLTKFDISSTDPENFEIQKIAMNLSSAGVALGMVAKMETLREGIKKIFQLLGNSGFPYSKIQHEKAVINHTTRGMEVMLVIDTGSLMHFGELILQIDPHLDPELIKRHIQWQKGGIYNNMQVIQTVEALNNTELYSFVKITRPPTPPPDGIVPMIIEASGDEGKNYTWEFSHKGNLGFNSTIAWRGRNLLGKTDFLDLKANAGQFKNSLSLTHTLPNAIWPESEFENKIAIEQTRWPAFEQVDARISSIFTTPIIDRLKMHAGYRFSLSDVRPKNKISTERSIVLVELPLKFTYDTFDVPQAPREGWNMILNVVPYLQPAPTRFVLQADLSQEILFPLTVDKRLVIDGWYQIGISPSVGVAPLPFQKRFYAGGLETIRAYGYQMAGPLDAQNYPVGGNSMLAAGVELQYYLTQNLSILGFFDLGSFYLSRYPNFGKRIFMGFGGGVKYATPYGNMQLDLALPSNRRPEDSRTQIYFSFGPSN